MHLSIVTGVVRTLPRFVQAAYRIIMGSILLTPAEGARASLFAATRAEALRGDALAPCTSPASASVERTVAARHG